jgi:hypothetical protein
MLFAYPMKPVMTLERERLIPLMPIPWINLLLKMLSLVSTHPETHIFVIRA